MYVRHDKNVARGHPGVLDFSEFRPFSDLEIRIRRDLKLIISCIVWYK